MQSEIDLQRKVSQEFSKNVQEARTEINRKAEGYKALAKAAEDKAAQALQNGDLNAYREAVQTANEHHQKADNWQKGGVALAAVATGLSAPTDSALGIAAATASPAAAYQIGQYFKELAQQNSDGKLTGKQETAHILAHAVLGAATAAAGDNNALAGTISAGSAEAAAPLIGNYLYGEKDGSKLTAEQKETVTAITNLLGTATGAAVGNSTANAVQGTLNADSAVENNGILDRDGFTPDERIQKDFLSSCVRLSSREECKKRFEQNKQENTKAIISFIADFVPVLGDIKGFTEAKTKGDYFFAVIGVIPLYGDALKRVHQAEKAYEAAKTAGNTQKMVEAIQDARKGADLPYEPQKIRTELEKRYGAENITSTTVPSKPQQSVNNQNKPDYTSTVTSNLSGKSVRVNYRDSVSGKSLAVNIAYDSRGLPIFDDVAKFTTRLDTSLSTNGQMRAATRNLRDAIEKGVISKSNFTSRQLKDIMAGRKTITGYIWHHNAQSAPNNMQLVPLAIHDAVRHTGQTALKQGR
ncbi:HNH endonuclease [Neisseria yangbaofengii]|uniref:HNH endonuclease n=2 Tax=Neisseria yangbaofengii TaxID=2709396 RepID=UPI003B9FAAC2